MPCRDDYGPSSVEYREDPETREYHPDSDIYFDYENITFLVRPQAITEGENAVFISMGSLKKTF